MRGQKNKEDKRMKRDDMRLKDSDKRMRHQHFIRTCGVIFCVLFLMAVDGRAADRSGDYPSRPVECVVHTVAGGQPDIFSRLIGDIIKTEKLLSQPMVVVNKPGSGGAVAQGYVFEREGNPHVMLAAASGSFICTPLMEKLPYTYKSFTPIANMAMDGCVLAVRSDSPFKTIDDLIAEARRRPKELIQAGGSFAAAESMMGRAMQKIKGVQWNFLSFSGGGSEQLLSLLSGKTHFVFLNPNSILDYVRTGKLRVLLAGAPNRFPEFPDAPTIKEAGMGDSLVTYRGFAGPPNMPDYAVKKLEPVFKKVMESDRFKKYLKDTVLQPYWLSSNAYGKFLDEENDRWKEHLKEVDLLKK
jgi:putative tricarboxylic transport membrane protein